MHKPLKGDFTQVINAIADGKGVKLQARAATPPTDKIVRASQATPPKKP
jgi:hypothetical protein